VKIVRDEEVVQKWVEEQSFQTVFTALNVPEEIKFESREAVEQHFRETHREAIIKQVKSHVISSKHASEQPNRAIKELYRRTLTQQTKFPIKVVHELSQQFSSRGLQFFKVNKTVTHVAVSRPRHLDVESTPVNDGVKKVIEFIDATPECNRRKLMEGLAPKTAEAAEEAAPEPAEAATQPEAGAEGESSQEAAAETQEKQQPASDGKLHLTPEEQKIHDDLHWLIHEGHVIEFANGILETAKAPKNPQAKDAAAAYETRRKKHKPRKPEAGANPAKSLDEAVSKEGMKEGEQSSSAQPAADEGSSSTVSDREEAAAPEARETARVEEAPGPEKDDAPEAPVEAAETSVSEETETAESDPLPAEEASNEPEQPVAEPAAEEPVAAEPEADSGETKPE